MKYLPKSDLRNSFWLIKLEKKLWKYTGFSIKGNIYQFKVVPFDLSSSSTPLIKVMQPNLDKFHEFCSYYIDYILLFTKCKDDYLLHIKTNN